jgi:CheY-like chemotaxis protein
MRDSQSIRVLVIEDNPDDAELLRRKLIRAEGAHIDFEFTERLSAALERLSAEKFDVVVSDLVLPDSQGFETFLTIHNRYPDIPVIVLTGHSDETLAINAVKHGAQDYLVKGQADGSMLVRSIRYSIERQKLIAQLGKSLKEIKTLRGLIPVCAWCRKIRDDRGYWKRVETYVEEHTEASFTHGICPECLKKTSPELFEQVKMDRPDIFTNEMNPVENDDPSVPDRIRVLSMCAHDIKNTILPSIWMLTRILSGKTQDRQADLESIRDALIAAERLLTHFIDLSRSGVKE